MQVAGEIRIGEATRWAGKAAARLNGYPWSVVISNVACGVTAAAFVFGFGVVQAMLALPSWTWLPALGVSLYAGWRIGMAACRGWCLRQARRAYGVRGLVDPVPTAFRIEEDVLVSLSGQIEIRAPWAAVSDIFLAGPYWVILAQSYQFYLPRRFFGAPDEEKAFLSAMLSRMGDAAVARSAEASAAVA